MFDEYFAFVSGYRITRRVCTNTSAPSNRTASVLDLVRSTPLDPARVRPMERRRLRPGVWEATVLNEGVKAAALRLAARRCVTLARINVADVLHVRAWRCRVCYLNHIFLFVL